jgi:HlyD family secretion protein
MTEAPDLKTLLAEHRRPWWKRSGVWVLALLLLAGVAGLWFWRAEQRANAAPHYVTEAVTRGDLSVSITATGTLQPTRSVAVGSELSGTVVRVTADVNDRVKKGQLLVELDRAKLTDAVKGARAELDAARARQSQAEVTAGETRASLARLEDLSRRTGGQLPAPSDLDAARAAADRAVADLSSARAAVAQASASLSTNETNLGKSSIRSPIDGIVLSRNVEPGNAVAASLQAVTLFTLAEDLTAMKLSVNVDEADVAQVKDGQRARFTVAAQAGREYPARVSRVAFGSTTTDNVVTYTTQLDVDNTDLSLRPGMTATAIIATTERTGVLLVPNSALRFTPGTAAAAAGASAGNGGSSGTLMSKLMPRPPGLGGSRRSGGTSRGAASASARGTVWVLREGTPVAIAVTRGLSNGRLTEVSGEGLAAGQAVIVDQTTAP